MSISTLSYRTGLLYLSLVVLGPLAFLILPEQYAIGNERGLLVLWIITELAIIGVEIILSVYLYKLFKVYDEKQSKLAFILRLLVVVVMSVNALFLVIILLGNVDVVQYLNLHSKFIYIWQIFFSLHVGLLGYMLYRNNQSYWRYLGIALILGGIGYLLDTIVNLGQIDFSVLNVISIILLIFVTIGEIGLTIGLIMKKVISNA